MRTSFAICEVLHFLPGIVDGTSHPHVPRPLTPAQRFLFALVLMLASLPAAIRMFTRHRVRGAACIGRALSASLALGLVFHFIAETADHVARVLTARSRRHRSTAADRRIQGR